MAANVKSEDLTTDLTDCSGVRKNGLYYFEQINELLKKSGMQIDEFDIIPSVKLEGETCPFVFAENKLGIFSWCVKPLLCFAYGELMSSRECKSVMTREGYNVMELSQVVLLPHPEDYTIWNMRKCYVTKKEDYARTELDFCALVLTKHPRSAETFSHRRWLINLLQRKEDQVLKMHNFLQRELKICLQCAERYPDNYIVWDHRCWIVAHFMSGKMMWHEELDSIKQWLWTHVSDNCVYHYRQYLIEKLASSCSSLEKKEMLVLEFRLTDEILKHYPVFETVWYHRRFLINYWYSNFLPCHSCLANWQTLNTSVLGDLKEKCEIQYQQCNACEKGDNEAISLHREMQLCHRTLTKTNRVQSVEQKRQTELAMSHLQWLQYFCKKLLGKLKESE